MNLDALRLFYKKFDRLDYNDKDILLMSSAILNSTIDINLSIRQNFYKYAELNNDFNPDSYFMKEVRNCDVPIYRLLIQDDDFFTLIINALRKNLFTSESFTDLLECYVDAVDKLTSKENSKVLNHIIEILSVKVNVDQEVLKNSTLLREFVLANLSTLGMSKYKRNNSDIVAKKMIILKLFRLGYVGFGDINDVVINYEDVLQPLINAFNYGQVKLVIYRDNVDLDDIDYVEDYLVNAIDANYEIANQEERDYGEKCKQDIKLAFSLRRENIAYKKRNV